MNKFVYVKTYTYPIKDIPLEPYLLLYLYAFQNNILKSFKNDNNKNVARLFILRREFCG